MKIKFVILMNDDVKAKCMSVEITHEMCIFNWTTHVQKGHMPFYTTILYWQLVGRKKTLFWKTVLI